MKTIKHRIWHCPTGHAYDYISQVVDISVRSLAGKVFDWPAHERFGLIVLDQIELDTSSRRS